MLARADEARTGAPLMAASESRYGIFGILWALYGVLLVAAAAFIIVYDGTLTLMWGAIINRVANPFAWMSFFHLFLVATVMMAVASAFFSFLAAISFMRGGAALRTWGLVAAAFGLLGPPVGVALGAFTVALLLPARTV
jgi:hypothetical protein